MPGSKQYAKYKKAKGKCDKKGKLVNPKTNRCIEKEGSIGKKLVNKAKTDRKAFVKHLTRLQYEADEAREVASHYGSEKKKKKHHHKNKRAQDDSVYLEECMVHLKKMADARDEYNRLYKLERAKNKRLRTEKRLQSPLKRLRKGPPPAGMQQALRVAAAAGAAAATDAVQSGIVKPAQAPALAAEAAMAAVTVTPTGEIVPLVIRRKPKPGDAPKAASAQTAVAAAVTVVEQKADVDITKKKLNTLVQNVGAVGKPQAMGKMKTHAERMHELMEKMAPSVQYKPASEVQEEDIMNSRLGGASRCDGHYLYVHAGEKPTKAQQEVMSALRGVKSMSARELVEDPGMMAGRCVIFDDIPYPDEETVAEIRSSKGRRAMRSVVRVVIISDAYNVNDFVQEVFEGISDRTDTFEGYHTRKDFIGEYSK